MQTMIPKDRDVRLRVRQARCSDLQCGVNQACRAGNVQGRGQGSESVVASASTAGSTWKISLATKTFCQQYEIIDDVSGRVLGDGLAVKARKLEMEFFPKKCIPRSLKQRQGIDAQLAGDHGRLVDSNRARLVRDSWTRGLTRWPRHFCKLSCRHAQCT